MKIAVDARSLTRRPSGTSSYLVTAINEISKRNPSWILYLLVHKELHQEAKKFLHRQDNIVIIKRPFILFSNVGIIWYLIKIFFILKNLKPDFFWAPGHILPPLLPKEIKTIVTVHDLVPKKYKKTMAFITRLTSDMFFNKSINNADILWAVSSYTRSEIERYFPNRKCKNIFVGSGINKSIFKKISISKDEKNKLLEKTKINGKFLLFVGSLEPRKNLEFLLSLIPELSKLSFSLLIVGCEGWKKKEIVKVLNQKDFPRDKVIFSNFLTTEELVKVFNIAAGYISTSVNEGFGLPQLEAMSCGCPVVTSHNSAMIEVVEGAGETVRGWNKKDWINTLKKVYLNRNNYVKLGLKRAEEFDWELIIRNLTKILETNK